MNAGDRFYLRVEDIILNIDNVGEIGSNIDSYSIGTPPFLH
ncbi:hypothetical protein PN499_00910 [Kamptonema animale CS-326]|nr:hypothetical protein [Kamptonema animale]MDB9509764.1 hypothetical protein [Kamptonema animale CS-326]